MIHNESVRRVNLSKEEELKQHEDLVLNSYAQKMTEREKKMQLKNQEMKDFARRIHEGIRSKEEMAKQKKEESLRELEKIRKDILTSH